MHAIMKQVLNFRTAAMLAVLTCSRAYAQDAPDSAIPTLADYARRDPIVAATLELPRDSARQKLRTVVRLLDLGEPAAAALVLPELLSGELDEGQRAALVREFGSARFMELIRLESSAADDLDDQRSEFTGAREFAQACLDAAAAVARDPERIGKLVAAATGPDEGQRIVARTDLTATGIAGVTACLEALAKADTKAARARLLRALAELSPEVNDPLLAAIAGGKGVFRRDAVELAGYLRLQAALPLVAALSVQSTDDAVAQAARKALGQLGINVAPTPAELETLIRRGVGEALSGVGEPPSGGRAIWYTWDSAASELQQREVSAAVYRVLSAARLADALRAAGGPWTPQQRRLAATLAIEKGALLGDETSAETQSSLQSLPTYELGLMLREASELGFFTAAIRTAKQLGARGDFGALATPDARPGPWAEALASPHRELRFAALEAVMKISPPVSFPGGSQVADALWYFALGSGRPTAISAAPVASRATTWAGQLSGLGYDAEVAVTGRGALQEAADPVRSASLAVVLLDSDLERPVARETLYQLRAN
ncbi:MAG: hypothetical protein AAF961_05160, partial [Planctomycetota bacterium]